MSDEVIDPADGGVSVPLASNIFVPKDDANARVRAALDVALASCDHFKGSREVALVKTKIDEALLWLSRVPEQKFKPSTLLPETVRE